VPVPEARPRWQPGPLPTTSATGPDHHGSRHQRRHGDTIKVRSVGASSRSYTVRLIGIDTPETRRPGVAVECGGREASAHMRTIAPAGLRVRLRTDPTQDRTDRYGRLLAYVDPVRGATLQTRMLDAGWATIYVYDRTAFQRLGAFRSAEDRARRAGRGAWKLCEGDFHRPARAAVAGADEPRAIQARRCGNLDSNRFAIITRGVGCRTAFAVVRRFRCNGADRCATGRSGRWRCTTRSLGYESGSIRCAVGRRTVRWRTGA
jgi:micrococcal nuclease